MQAISSLGKNTSLTIPLPIVNETSDEELIDFPIPDFEPEVQCAGNPGAPGANLSLLNS